MFTLIRGILYATVLFGVNSRHGDLWLIAAFVTCLALGELVLFVCAKQLELFNETMESARRLREVKTTAQDSPFQHGLAVTFSSLPVSDEEVPLVEGIMSGRVEDATEFLRMRCKQDVDFNQFPSSVRLQIAQKIVDAVSQGRAEESEWDEFLED